MTCPSFRFNSVTNPLEIVKEAIARDKNHLFKFNVGDRVIKRWVWARGIYNRFHKDRMDMGGLSNGAIIECIEEDGTICALTKNRMSHWHFGASELDLISQEE